MLTSKIKEHKITVRDALARKKRSTLTKVYDIYNVDIVHWRKSKRYRKRSPVHRPSDNSEENLKAENIDSGVFNVSGKTLSDAESKLLIKGLKFCPTPLRLDKLALQKDLDYFKRRLCLFEYFNSDKDSEKGSTDSEVPRYRNKSTWTPPAGRDSFLDSFLEAVQREVHAFQPPNYIKDNLTSEERAALTNLRTDDNIVMKPEDKGPAFVIQNKTAYIHTAKTD
ncbi:hypothetical protein HOLleu_20984 [Holothuria leucospilota]|uniref:Uncharacterized protein n=1 Tax=Holothuria leucospilota TaxID=206669 RepID=A0A9Q1BX73_HOLLE|nr:hypothetical protein HOLleu_20984 [Holothuria leucospilota]